MTVSNGDIIKAVADFTTADSHHMQNVWYWVAQFASDQTDAAVLAAILTFLGNAYDELAAEIPSDLDDPDVAVDLVDWDTDHWETTQRVGEGIAGTTLTNAADILPYANAPYVVMRTARPRSAGRRFLPVFGEDANVNGYLTAGSQTDLALFLTWCLADVTVAASNTLSPGVPSTVTGTFLPFINGFLSGLFGTQRRRRQGYGI